MRQLILPGFEEYVNIEETIFDPEGLIDNLNRKGYFWLTDFNSGKLLVKGVMGDGPYIPYRIEFPSGVILDEEEIFMDFGYLEKLSFLKCEVENARLLYYAVNHEKTDKHLYKFDEPYFVSEEDETNTLKKYSENPFYLDN